MRSLGRRRPREYQLLTKRPDGQRWLATQVSMPSPSLGLLDVARAAMRGGRRLPGRTQITDVEDAVFTAGASASRSMSSPASRKTPCSVGESSYSMARANHASR
jgi:hypothetical protein